MTLQRRFNRQLSDLWNTDDVFGMSLLKPFRTIPNYRSLNLDLVETDKEFTLRVPLPGLTKEDISVEVTNGDLIMNAQASTESDDSTKYVYRGVSTASFNKTITRIEEQFSVDSKKVTAKYINGVLEVIMPKKKATTVKSISVTVE